MNIKLSTAILSLVLSAAGLLSASADNNVSLHDNNSTNPQAIYYIDAPRFVRPLVEKWITEYQKVQPAAHFAVAKSAANRDASILHVQLSDNTAGNGQKTVYFAQYAILPVTTKGSDADKALSRNEAQRQEGSNRLFSPATTVMATTQMPAARKPHPSTASSSTLAQAHRACHACSQPTMVRMPPHFAASAS